MIRTLIMVLLLCLSGCCSTAALKALDRGIAANKGHMADTSLPIEAREIATDNYDLMNQVKFNCDGTELPADTAARVEVRQAKDGSE